jgi:hypothetical protein
LHVRPGNAPAEVSQKSNWYAFATQVRNLSCWRNLRVQPKPAFSPLSAVHRIDLEGPLGVEFTRLPSRPPTPPLQHCRRPPRRLRMAAILQAVTSASTRFGFDPNPRLCRLIPRHWLIGTARHSRRGAKSAKNLLARLYVAECILLSGVARSIGTPIGTRTGSARPRSGCRDGAREDAAA